VRAAEYSAHVHAFFSVCISLARQVDAAVRDAVVRELVQQR
jgi:hypothetical protein